MEQGLHVDIVVVEEEELLPVPSSSAPAFRRCPQAPGGRGRELSLEFCYLSRVARPPLRTCPEIQVHRDCGGEGLGDSHRCQC